MADNFNKLVYEIVKNIPIGKVMSYGQIAAIAGNSRASRAVGYAMHAAGADIPWHRVVFKDGRLPFPGNEGQRELLANEGVAFTGEGYVDMQKCRLDMNEAGEIFAYLLFR